MLHPQLWPVQGPVGSPNPRNTHNFINRRLGRWQPSSQPQYDNCPSQEPEIGKLGKVGVFLALLAVTCYVFATGKNTFGGPYFARFALIAQISLIGPGSDAEKLNAASPSVADRSDPPFKAIPTRQLPPLEH